MSESGNRQDSLIVQARRNEAGALDRLLESFRNYLHLLARTSFDASLRGKADPSDLVQDTMLRACQRFDQFQGVTEAELAGWLRQILSHCLTDLARRFVKGEGRRVSREQSLDQSLGRSSQALERLVSAKSSGPSASAMRRDMGVVLSDALALLPADYREVLVLHELEELDWDEVAGRMGRSVGAVRKLWTRALQQLRPLIESKL